MYLLEFNNHKALRTKNVTYSELIRFFLLSCPSHCLSLLLSDSYKSEEDAVASIYRQSIHVPSAYHSHGLCTERAAAASPPPPTAPPKYTSQRKLPKGSWIRPRNGHCLGSLSSAVCFLPGAPSTSSLAPSVWSHAPRLCCTLRDIPAEAAAVKASALIHFCEILLPGKIHGYGWSTTQVTASSEQVYSCGINSQICFIQLFPVSLFNHVHT